jgi:hypothetical protein
MRQMRQIRRGQHRRAVARFALFVSLTLGGFFASSAFGQVGGVLDVTSTLSNVTSGAVSTVENTATSATSTASSTAEGTAEDAAAGGAAAGGAAQPSGGGNTSTTSNSSNSSPGGDTSGANMTCGEAARDPKTFGAYMATFKEHQAGGNPGASGAGTERAGGVAGAKAGEQDLLPVPSLVPGLVGPNDVVGGEGPQWLAFVVAGVLLFGLGALLGGAARLILARRAS